MWNFIYYILLEPLYSISFNDLQTNMYFHLYTKLLKIANANISIRYDILKNLIIMLPCYLINTYQFIDFNIHIYDNLIDFIDTSYSQDEINEKQLIFLLLENFLNLCCQLKNKEQSLLAILPIFEKLILKFPQHISTSKNNLFILGWLLFSSSETEQFSIIHLINKIIDHMQQIQFNFNDHQTIKNILMFLIYPILQILLSSSNETKSITSLLFNKIELIINSPPLYQSNSTKSILNFINKKKTSHILNLLLNSQSFLLDLLSHGMESQIEDITNKIFQWLQSIEEKLIFKETITQFLLYIIAPFLLNYQKQVRIITTNIISKISKLSAFKGLSFLPLLLYQLLREKDSEVQLKILYTIPTLATHQICVTPILRTIIPLTKIKSLQSLSLRLLCKLWEYQERIFPRIYVLLVNLSQEESLDIKLSVASCLKDICFKKPQHGIDVISIITKIICEESHPSPVSICLEAINYLCKENILEFKTTWSIVSKKLNNDLRPLVQQHLASFFANGSVYANSDKEEDQNFIRNIIQKLWNFIKSPNSNIRKEAYKSLSLYAEANIEYFGDFSVKDYVSLLCEIDSEAKRECEKLVIIFLKHELNQTRVRNVPFISNNRILKLLESIFSYLLNLYENSKLSLRSGIAGGNFFLKLKNYYNYIKEFYGLFELKKN